MRLEFSQEELRKLVTEVAAALVPRIVEEIKTPDRLVWPHNELAKTLGISAKTLAGYRDQGLIVGSQPGRGWLYAREAVLRFLADTQVN
jgi:hypothetical protein